MPKVQTQSVPLWTPTCPVTRCLGRRGRTGRCESGDAVAWTVCIWRTPHPCREDTGRAPRQAHGQRQQRPALSPPTPALLCKRAQSPVEVAARPWWAEGRKRLRAEEPARRGPLEMPTPRKGRAAPWDSPPMAPSCPAEDAGTEIRRAGWQVTRRGPGKARRRHTRGLVFPATPPVSSQETPGGGKFPATKPSLRPELPGGPGPGRADGSQCAAPGLAWPGRHRLLFVIIIKPWF